MSVLKRGLKRALRRIGSEVRRLPSHLGTMSVKSETVWPIIEPYTMLNPQRLQTFSNAAEYFKRAKVSGDFVEAGCWRGGSAAWLSTLLPADARLWLYDSFQGMPEPSEQDGQEMQRFAGISAAARADLEHVLSLVGADFSRVVIREGWFEDTFQLPLPATVALLHVDSDWYQSVLLTLRTFYPLMPDGACVVLDDFGAFPGAREAFYDFCRETDEKPLLHRASYGQAFWFKSVTYLRNWEFDEQGRQVPTTPLWPHDFA